MRRCYVCKTEIDFERIQAMPETRLCKRHGQEIEPYGGEFLRTASQERTSKQGSLKLNYGGISLVTTRNQAGMDRLKEAFEEASFEN